jgi:hypothetical protein
MDKAGIRRVVTGISPEGKSVVVSDAAVAPITAAMMPGWEYFYFWGDDEPLTYPSDGRGAALPQLVPRPRRVPVL